MRPVSKICLVLSCAALMASACTSDNVCDPGVTQTCLCVNGQGVQSCAADGKSWSTCQCGNDNNNNSNDNPDAAVPNDGTVQHDGAVQQDAAVSLCDPDEVQQPGTNLCWQRCLGDQNWDGSGCVGGLGLMTYANAEGYCQPNYRFPTIDEVTALLSNCELVWNTQYEEEEWHCYSCANSPTCASMFPATADGTFWISSTCTSSIWSGVTVWQDIGWIGINCVPRDGQMLNAHPRCLRTAN